MYDWLIYLLVWLTAFLGAHVPNDVETPKVPVVTTTTTTTVVPPVVDDTTTTTVVDDSADVIAEHTYRLKNFHVAYEANLLALALHGEDSLAYEYASADLKRLRRWQDEWHNSGVVYEAITKEYEDLVGLFIAFLARET